MSNEKNFLEASKDALNFDLLSQIPERVNSTNFKKKAAILIPLIKDHELKILLTRRTFVMPRHRGEISFPGGLYEIEKDSSLISTVFRETKEELGIKESHIKLLGTLPFIKTSSNIDILPFVGLLDDISINALEKSFNTQEIRSIFSIPLESFMNERVFKKRQINFNGKSWSLYFVHVNQHIIWGATALILKSLVTLLKNNESILEKINKYI